MNEQKTATVPEPTMGGSYVRNEDGSLTRVAHTEPAKPRDKRAEGEPNTDAPPASVDPEAATSAASGAGVSGAQE
jgi:hypothetical protein